MLPCLFPFFCISARVSCLGVVMSGQWGYNNQWAPTRRVGRLPPNMFVFPFVWE